ncbi:MAG: TraM recognition domain-containing protein [Legionella sp.]|jgi:intracellular multiplication protein IcmO|nr:TraM recognition domain-containing protein [Legionella sp.]
MRGVEARHEMDPTLLLRDTRTLSQRIKDFFADSVNVTALICGIAIVSYAVPEIALLGFILGGLAGWYTLTRKQILPFRMPMTARVKDYNDLIPGIKKPNMSRGIAFFGNDNKTSEELWFANDDMRTHALIFGSTGSGKTEALVSIAYNALVQGSGFIYVDGKGDNSLYAKVFSMVRSMGREDDLLLINFMTGARDIIGPQEKRLSNTLNPFCQGSSSMLTQLVVNLMGSSGQGDGDMWKGRAIAFVEALMRLLVYMRDEGAILLDANSIRNYFDLQRLESIVIDKVFPRDDQESVNIESIPKLVTDPLRNYLKTLPGYNPEKKGKQVSQVLEQHGFITMQLVRSFSSLADTYGHIIRTNLAEVDFKDVILNRRVLVVLLPALEKSPDELANLGKVIVASLKAMMAAGLGEDVEGDYRDVIERKPTNAPTPYMCILDEYGYYAVEGFAVVPAQARSLGFSAIFAGQDLPAFQKSSKEEAASIGANTNIKICMKLEDPTETWDFFTKTAGEAYVTKVDAFQTEESGISNTYKDTKSSSFERRARVDLLDLKEQTEGEAHIFFKSKIVRARMFYANPKPVARLKVNQFLKVEPPPDVYLNKLMMQAKSFQEALARDDLTIRAVIKDDEVPHIAHYLREAQAADPMERGVAALLAFHKRNEPEEVEALFDETPPENITIFSELREAPEGSPAVKAADVKAFSKALLPIQEARDYLMNIGRLCGDKDKLAGAVANEIVKDLQMATAYPPERRVLMEPNLLADSVKTLVKRIDESRKAGAKGK